MLSIFFLVKEICEVMVFNFSNFLQLAAFLASGRKENMEIPKLRTEGRN